jgi:hypothetical protein
MNRYPAIRTLLAVSCLLFSTTGMTDQESGETVLKRGSFAEDVYIAGGRVDVLAEVDGDVLAVGGRVAIDSQVTGDVFAVGGSVTVHGSIDDDVRLGGGEVIINAKIGDDIVAAGGNVLLAPGANVGGDVMLSGGRVALTGRVRGDARIAGGLLMIAGQIDGDAELMGRSIEIGPNALILGTLTYHSPEPAEIHAQARIEGTITHIPTPLPSTAEIGRGLVVAAVLLWLSLALTGIALYLLFPQETLSVASTIAIEPWKALGLGLAVFAATPVVGVMLLSTGVGWILAWLVMTVYCLLLLFGFLCSILFLGSTTLRRIRHGQEPSKLGTSLAFMLALLGVMIVGLIPLLGWLLVFIALLFGVGGTTLLLYRARRAEAA